MGPVEALLDSPEKWTKNALAKNANGHCCDVESQYATCFCIGGALMRVSKISYNEKAAKQFCEANGIEPVHELGGSKPYWLGMVRWNNDKNRTYEEVITAVRKAGI